MYLNISEDGKIKQFAFLDNADRAAQKDDTRCVTLDELATIPRTADGELIVPGMRVWLAGSDEEYHVEVISERLVDLYSARDKLRKHGWVPSKLYASPDAVPGAGEKDA